MTPKCGKNKKVAHEAQPLYGRHVKIQSDHKPLESILKKSIACAPKRLQGMMMRLQKYEYEYLANRTQIADLLNFVLRSTYFQYNVSIYEQQEGAAMGSPVSAVIASIYMEEFEEQAIASATCKTKIWKRYVDDIFSVLERDHVHGFLQHLKSQRPTICFTMEIEKGNTIPFLDTTVTRDLDGLLTTTVYRKPTHTDQYLAYDSHHPRSVKRA